MRMRKKKNFEPRMAACSEYLVESPADNRGKWRGALPADCKLKLEIGCGKGRFVIESAKAEPDSLFIAVERERNVLLMAMEKAKREQITNVRFVDADAATLSELFAPSEVDVIYLNFSDPWLPKKQHKRRLTYRGMLDIYSKFLKPTGTIEMKTDNTALFEFSLEEFSACGFVLSQVTFDLHKTDTPNIMTEYEQNFSEKGMNIYRCVASRPCREWS